MKKKIIKNLYQAVLLCSTSTFAFAQASTTIRVDQLPLASVIQPGDLLMIDQVTPTSTGYTLKKIPYSNMKIGNSQLLPGSAVANLGFTPLAPANNLADVLSATTARTNLSASGRVATLSVLQSSSTTQFPNGVWRDDYSAGLGAPPLLYQPLGVACSVNSGAGDGGSQVASADGKCWVARPTGGWDWREFGASTGATAAANRDAAIAATAAAVRTGLSVFLPAGSYSIDTTTTPFSSTSKFSVTSDGQAVLFPTGGGTVFQTTGGGSISNVIVYTTTNPTTGVGILYDGTGGLNLNNVGVAGMFTNFECKSCSGLMANNVTFSGNNSTTGSTLLRIHAKDGSVGSTPGDLFIANAQIRASVNGGYTHAVVVNALDGLQMVNAHIGFTAADAMLLQPEYTTGNLVGINCASCGIDLNNGGSASGIVMAPLAGFTGHRGANTFVLTQINGAPASGSQCLAISDPAEQGDAFIGFVAGNCGSSGVSITAGSGVKFLGGSLSNNNLANDGSPDMAIANASNVSVRLDMASGAHVPAEHVLVSGTSTNVSVSAENVYSGAVSANVANTSGTALAGAIMPSTLAVTGATTLSGGTTFYNGLDVVSGFANVRGGVNIGSSGVDPGYANVHVDGSVSTGKGFIAGGSSPTLTTGQCQGSNVTGGATAGTFVSAGSCILGRHFIISNLPVAPTGWACFAADRTTAATTVSQTDSSTTSATLIVLVSAAMPPGDVIQFSCTGY